jgi:predicted nucleotide-binding protein (sugar kinase/HSP70/actin superfamily)
MPIVLFSGLTYAHEILLKAFLEHLGYEADRLPEPDNEALRIGKTYCNKGECNPLYYTAGNIVKYLLALKEKGERDIEANYVYITAGSCGPCRFGMYETEYRKAVRDAGFGDFRIVALQQSQALLSDLEEMGFAFHRKSFRGFVKAFIAADLVNNVYYKTKPYERESGSIDRWKAGTLEALALALKTGMPLRRSFREARNLLSRVELDYFRPKPLVKITGEFFSQMQEGDANYRLPGWLVEEGAEPIVEPITTWLDYIIWTRVRHAFARAFRSWAKAARLISLLFVLKAYIHHLYCRYRQALGKKPDLLASQRKLARYAGPYFNPQILGGEGHLEVGKHIHSIRERKAHLVVSVKPFGCMSSTQSDGVQTKVTRDIPESLFISVDTSGDAEVNYKSRVLMKLYEAKKKAAAEYGRAMRSAGLDPRRIEALRETRRFPRSASLALPESRKRSADGICTAARALALLGGQALKRELRRARCSLQDDSLDGS